MRRTAIRHSIRSSLEIRNRVCSSVCSWPSDGVNTDHRNRHLKHLSPDPASNFKFSAGADVFVPRSSFIYSDWDSMEFKVEALSCRPLASNILNDDGMACKRKEIREHLGADTLPPEALAQERMVASSIEGHVMQSLTHELKYVTLAPTRQCLREALTAEVLSAPASTPDARYVRVCVNFQDDCSIDICAAPGCSMTIDQSVDDVAGISDESDVAVSDLEDSSDEPNDEGANNSAEAVAVRRAFLASVHSSAGSQDDEGTWTGDQILSWVTDAMDLAVAADDRQKGVKIFWLEWSRIDHFSFKITGNKSCAV